MLFEHILSIRLVLEQKCDWGRDRAPWPSMKGGKGRRDKAQVDRSSQKWKPHLRYKRIRPQPGGPGGPSKKRSRAQLLWTSSRLHPGPPQPLAYGADKGKVMGLASLNHFLSSGSENTVSREACKLPTEKGSCRGSIPRWFYNSETYDCEPFLYRGCGGNGNNFLREKLGRKPERTPDFLTRTQPSLKSGLF